MKNTDNWYESFEDYLSIPEKENSSTLDDTEVSSKFYNNRDNILAANEYFYSRNKSTFSSFDEHDVDVEIVFSYNIDTNKKENDINEYRTKILNEKITATFLNLLREEDFEFGYKTRSEELLQEQLSINTLATRNWLNRLFIKNFSNDVILSGILRIIGRFEPNVIFPQGQTMALAALTHKNDEIKELGVRAFEKWCSIQSLDILKNIKVETVWLQDYIEEVIEDFEEQLCLS